MTFTERKPYRMAPTVSQLNFKGNVIFYDEAMSLRMAIYF